VQIDTLAVRLRPRAPLEAVDLGVRLCQHAAGSVYRCYLPVALPVIVLALACHGVNYWLPGTIIWCAKPWFDRAILFVLSRAAFGQATTPADLFRARHVLWSQLLFTWTVQRLSLWRSLTAPVYQLEGLSLRKARPRVRQIRRRNVGPAMMMTGVFAMTELALWTSLVSLLFWMAPLGLQPDLGQLFWGEPAGFTAVAMSIAYAIAVLFLEPFFVAAGFAMYLNRRAELEAWDIEQEFRRAFAQ
jgi:hypothetical protein